MSTTAPANVPLTVVSTTSNQFMFAQIGIGKNILSQQPAPNSGPYYWFVVINRETLKVEFNQVQQQPNVVPNIGALNTDAHILVVATLGVGLNNQPQGALFTFLDENGAGRELRRIDQVAVQFNCGSLGTFGYALAGVLGNLNQPAFEASALLSNGPILTLQLVPHEINGKVLYTPSQIDNA